jgi:HAD superfamily hydrolase (TIGR01490 family)
VSAPSRQLCLFDLDGTLIANDSNQAFGEFLAHIGWVDGPQFLQRQQGFFDDYVAGTLDLAAYIDFATSGWRHRPLDEARAARERFMGEVMRPQLRAQPGAQSLVQQHQNAGDLVAIVTATNEFVTAPIAAAFGVDHLLAVQLDTDASGRYTGAIHGVPTFREGKVQRVHSWLAGLGHQLADFSDVVVYSDSSNDLPLLELATVAVAPNPGASLEATARERGWRILNLFT